MKKLFICAVLSLMFCFNVFARDGYIKKSCFVYQDQDCKEDMKICFVCQGTKVRIVSNFSGKMLIRFEDEDISISGYVDDAKIADDEVEEVMIENRKEPTHCIINQASLKAEKSIASKVLVSFKQEGSFVAVLEESDDFSRVQYDNDNIAARGWISTKFLVDAEKAEKKLKEKQLARQERRNEKARILDERKIVYNDSGSRMHNIYTVHLIRRNFENKWAQKNVDTTNFPRRCEFPRGGYIFRGKVVEQKRISTKISVGSFNNKPMFVYIHRQNMDVPKLKNKKIGEYTEVVCRDIDSIFPLVYCEKTTHYIVYTNAERVVK